MEEKFSKIAAYEQEDFRPAIIRAVNEPTFEQVLLKITHSEEKTKDIISFFNNCQTREESDDIMIMPALEWLVDNASQGLTMEGEKNIHFPALFITNHRDIILDSAFLSLLLYMKYRERIYIGIGTNLYVQPWIEDFVRANKTFSVIRGGTPRELLQHSTLLSEYIRHIIADQHHSAWIAQREGRAKDSDDRTQAALLKMLTMAGEGDFIEKIKQLNITPIALSYEFDPCDYLKAQEFQLKRDNPQYKKTEQDDYMNMFIGMFGFKGHIVFNISESINGELDAIAEQTDIRNEQVNLTAQLIDRHIHSHYHIFNVNRIAYDMLKKTGRFAHLYSEEESNAFAAYIMKQIEKINIPQKDEQFLKQKLLEMYANPLINQLAL